MEDVSVIKKAAEMNAEHLLTHFDRIADAPDAIPRLRRFILDLAVRGKLVPQDPNDEPASELLKRIAAEKARLVKAGEIKKTKVLAELTEDEKIFGVPKGWGWVRLGDIATYMQRGRSPKYATGTNVVVISQKCVQWSGLDLSVAKEIDTASFQDYEDYRLLRDEDLLWNSTGTGTIGRVVRVTCPAEKLVCDSHVTLIRCPHVVSEYIRIWLRSDHVYGVIEDRAAGSTKQVELTSGLALGWQVPLPPLAEQHRIVAKVDELMTLCDRLEAARIEREATRNRMAAASLARLNAPDPDPATFQNHATFALNNLTPLTTRPDQIKAFRQTILNLAVRGKLVPQNPNDEPASELLKRIREWQIEAIAQKQIRAPRKSLKLIRHDESPYLRPNGWEWARLGEVIYIQSGDGLTAANMRGGDVPVFGGNGINGYHDTRNVDQPTIIIGRVGYYCGSIHVTPPKAWVTDNAFITHFCQDAINLRFLVLLLNGTNLKEDENATAQPVISGSKIYPIIVGLPPLAEQHRIVAKVDELMTLCDRLEASLALGDESRGRLLEALLCRSD